MYCIKLIVIFSDREVKIENSKFALNYYYWDRNYVQIGSDSGNYTIFGFCHDLLNLLNSVTFT